MKDLLNNFSELHNYKQQHGLAIVGASTVTAYRLERKLFRILESEISSETALAVAKKSGFSIIEIEDLVEGKAYDLGQKEIEKAISSYEKGGIAECLKSIDKAAVSYCNQGY